MAWRGCGKPVVDGHERGGQCVQPLVTSWTVVPIGGKRIDEALAGSPSAISSLGLSMPVWVDGGGLWWVGWAIVFAGTWFWFACLVAACTGVGAIDATVWTGSRDASGVAITSTDPGVVTDCVSMGSRSIVCVAVTLSEPGVATDSVVAPGSRSAAEPGVDIDCVNDSVLMAEKVV